MEDPRWIEKVKITFRFHRAKMSSQERWTATMTANALHRSVGSVSEDLLVARWLRTHEEQILKFNGLKEAVDWIRKKEREMKLRDLD